MNPTQSTASRRAAVGTAAPATPRRNHPHRSRSTTGGTAVDGPHIRVEETGEIHPLTAEVTTVGRGRGVDILLSDSSVSRLHAEIVRRGPYAYVVAMGLSRNGTRGTIGRAHVCTLVKG